MTTNKQHHLKNLLNSVVPNTVFLSQWLQQMGISRDLQQYYKKSGWISTIGSGAFVRPADKPEWYGAIYALQNQTNLHVHPGGHTALSLQGFAHYLRMGNEKLSLFCGPSTKLPKWLTSHKWGMTLESHTSSFLPNDLSLVRYQANGFQIDISSPERAIVECLYLAPGKMDLVECYHLMEGLVNLRPLELQKLLENCASVKVKRLFLYMADKSKQSWLKYIDKPKIDIGSGDRSLAKNGVYIKSYGITVTKELDSL